MEIRKETVAWLRGFKGVLIDLDGTLVEFARPYASFLHEIVSDFEVSDPDVFLASYHRRISSEGAVTFRDSVAGAFEEFGSGLPVDFERLARKSIEGYGAGIARLPHTDSLLAALDGVPKAIVSNGPSDMQWAAISAAALESHFSAMLVSGDADVAVRKPSAEIFLMACERLGVLPSEAVMIGDNDEADIEGARAAGLAAIHVRELVHA